MIRVSIDDGKITKGFSLSLNNIDSKDLWLAILDTIHKKIDEDFK